MTIITEQSNASTVAIKTVIIPQGLIDAAKYKWVHPLAWNNFQAKDMVVSDGPRIFVYDRPMTSQEIIVDMDRRGYRPATLGDLLAFSARTNARGQVDDDGVIALGSVTPGEEHVPMVSKERSTGRGLALPMFDNKWVVEQCRFLVVHK